MIDAKDLEKLQAALAEAGRLAQKIVDGVKPAGPHPNDGGSGQGGTDPKPPHS